MCVYIYIYIYINKYIYIYIYVYIGTNTAAAYCNIGNYYRKLAEAADEACTTELEIKYLRKTKLKYEEALKIYTKIQGPNHPRTLEFASNLSDVLNALSEAISEQN
jgi:hypothetical protein